MSIPQSFSHSAGLALSHLEKELQRIRTGRASVSLLDDVKVEAYGSSMKLVEVASLSTPDPSLIVIAPWDKSLLSAIEKAILTSGLNLQPAVDSASVRLPIPPLTQEKRQEMVKLVYKKLEEAKIMLRNARQEAKKIIEAQKDSGHSEDEVDRDLKELDDMQKDYVEKFENLAKQKETALLQV